MNVIILVEADEILYIFMHYNSTIYNFTKMSKWWKSTKNLTCSMRRILSWWYPCIFLMIFRKHKIFVYLLEYMLFFLPGFSEFMPITLSQYNLSINFSNNPCIIGGKKFNQIVILSKCSVHVYISMNCFFDYFVSFTIFLHA